MGGIGEACPLSVLSPHVLEVVVQTASFELEAFGAPG